MLSLNEWLDQLCGAATPDIDECVQQLGAIIPWLLDLKKTKQDPGWHAEGDVHIHTGMVLQELYQLLQTEAAYIQGSQRQALILAAIFHDIGKSRCTRRMVVRGESRLGSPDHESVGRSYLAFQLPKLPLSFEVIWTVLGLVGEHQVPKMLVVQHLKSGHYIALSRRADLALLYWLERADMQGRIGEGIPQQLEYLEAYRQQCLALNLWHQPYQPKNLASHLHEFSSQAKRYLTAQAVDAMQRNTIQDPVEVLSKYAHCQDEYPELYLLCGPSGIGKSRFVAKQCEGMDVVSLDEIREQLWNDRTCQDDPETVVATAMARCKALLAANKRVVWDATNLRQEYRKPIYALARQSHALITLVIFIAPEADIYQGNASRKYAVPKRVLARQLERSQFPRLSDAHAVIVVDGEGNQRFAQNACEL